MSFWNKLPIPFYALAPMEDVTDTVFRRFVAKLGRPHVFFTEFTNVDGLMSPGRDRVAHRLKFTDQERPLVAQIWGNDPENYLKASALLVEMGFRGIDINMGCPVSKVVRRGSCSGLIDNPTLAREIILATIEGSGQLPVSVKTRIGVREVVTEAWCSSLLELPIAALTVHGRTAKQLSKVPADWDEIGKVVQIRDSLQKKTLVIGNGDVMSLREADQKVAKHRVDGVMIGRGIFTNPFLFADRDQPRIDSLTREQRLELLDEHLTLFEETWEQGARDFSILKKFFKIYVSGFPGAVEIRSQLMAARNVADTRDILGS
ncbi:MAG: tRNA-dihydrouridine synthase, partial [Bdellovibrionales bacterium]|nr:tRNA-dihydrouridine synthase [Bdellovibrionales bacterium]